MLNRFLKIRKDARGVAMLEFALALPVLLLLLFGGIELARYVLVDQKAALVNDSATDILSQMDLTEGDVQSVVASLPRFMNPYGFDPKKDSITFSVVESTDGAQTIRKLYGSKTRLAPNQGPLANIGNNTVVVGEMFYGFSPLLIGSSLNSFLGAEIYKVAVFRPRAGLDGFTDACSTCFTGGPCPPECKEACIVPGDPDCVSDPCDGCPGPGCPAVCEDPCASCAADPANCAIPACLPPECLLPGVCTPPDPSDPDFIRDPCTEDPAPAFCDPPGDSGGPVEDDGECPNALGCGCIGPDCGGGGCVIDCGNENPPPNQCLDDNGRPVACS